VQPDTLFCALSFPAFPAQVIAAYDERLRGRAFCVTSQDPESHKSAVIACSAEAALMGLEPGMPMHIVRRKWPGAGLVAHDAVVEQSACDEISRVLSGYSPCFEVQQRGSAMIDLSRTPASRALDPRDIAARLRRDIVAAVLLRQIAAGIAASPGTALIMARHARPDGTAVCAPGCEMSTIAGFNVSLMPGLSSACRAKLKSYGLLKIGQIQSLDKQALVRRFGAEGEKLYALCRGLTSHTVRSDKKPVFAETILDRDINDHERLIQKVRYTADRFCFLLKSSGDQIDAFIMMLSYSDGKKTQKTVRLTCATNDFLTITGHAQPAFDRLYARRVALRSIVLRSSHSQTATGQLDLFTTERETKQEDLARQIVKVRSRNTFDAVVSGATMQRDCRAHTPPAPTGEPSRRGREKDATTGQTTLITAK
jgi:DNA polymerase-4